jgi:hypothetical protein
MAQPTTSYSPAQQQAPTPGVTHGATPPPTGVGMMGAAPPVVEAEAAKPVLIDDIDPVLLVRLYPGAKDSAEMRAQAMAAGEATYAAGQELVASQQEPVVVLGEPVAPPPRPAPNH